MIIKLTIRGGLTEACRAASQRHIPLGLCSMNEHGETIGYALEEHALKVAQWGGEAVDAPFPAGTLLAVKYLQ